MSSDIRWYITTDNLVVLEGLHNSLDKVYVNDAIITGVLADKDGTTVTGAESITFTYLAASNGKYTGNIPDTLSLTEGDMYTLTLTITATIDGTGYKATKKIDGPAEYEHLAA